MMVDSHEDDENDEHYDNDDEEEEEDYDDEMTHFPPPREHSYLPPSHPLLQTTPTTTVSTTTTTTTATMNMVQYNDPSGTTGGGGGGSSSSSSSSSFLGKNRILQDLLVLPLHQVVLVPGCIIPVKLTRHKDQAIIAWLGRKINECRHTPHLRSHVNIGFLPQPTTQEEDEEDEEDEDENDDHDVEKLEGRYGTIATIQHTNEHAFDDDNNNHNHHDSSIRSPWQRYESRDELTFTAVGVARFKILHVSKETLSASSFSFSSSSAARLCHVEEIIDAPLVRKSILPKPFPWVAIPPTTLGNQQRTRFVGDNGDDENSDKATYRRRRHHHHHWQRFRHQQHAWSLSMMTPIPYHVYEQLSPWKLVDDLVYMLQGEENNNNNNNLLSVGQSLTKDMLEPTKLSFWLLNNLPFSDIERIKLLGMRSTLERLKWIHQRVQQLTGATTTTKTTTTTTSTNPPKVVGVYCKGCETRLAISVRNLFVFDGAEGVTSNYVNPDGCIHQITTLRTDGIDPTLFLYSPQTHYYNSYFPGYGWQITVCGTCRQHLGWTFHAVHRSRGNGGNQNRPDQFYGFQASMLTTKLT